MEEEQSRKQNKNIKKPWPFLVYLVAAAVLTAMVFIPLRIPLKQASKDLSLTAMLLIIAIIIVPVIVMLIGYGRWYTYQKGIGVPAYLIESLGDIIDAGQKQSLERFRAIQLKSPRFFRLFPLVVGICAVFLLAFLFFCMPMIDSYRLAMIIMGGFYIFILLIFTPLNLRWRKDMRLIVDEMRRQRLEGLLPLYKTILPLETYFALYMPGWIIVLLDILGLVYFILQAWAFSYYF